MFVLRTDYAAIGRPVIFGLAVNSNIGIEGFWNFIFKSLKQLCIFAASMILIKLELKTLLVGLNKNGKKLFKDWREYQKKEF